MDESVVILEDWNERDGKVYYRWQKLGENHWHERLTPYKQKPVIQFKRISEVEFKVLKKSD